MSIATNGMLEAQLSMSIATNGIFRRLMLEAQLREIWHLKSK